MVDLIRRQDAVDAIEALGAHAEKYVMGDGIHGFQTGLAVAKWHLECLPSLILLKDKCCICPHCSNCDVNDDGEISSPMKSIDGADLTEATATANHFFGREGQEADRKPETQIER